MLKATTYIWDQLQVITQLKIKLLNLELVVIYPFHNHLLRILIILITTLSVVVYRTTPTLPKPRSVPPSPASTCIRRISHISPTSYSNMFRRMPTLPLLAYHFCQIISAFDEVVMLKEVKGIDNPPSGAPTLVQTSFLIPYYQKVTALFLTF